MNIEYYIIDPAGNITALVTTAVPREEYKPVAAFIMKSNKDVEQVGFVNFENNNINLNMSGGEFCGNATMSAAALCYSKNGLSGSLNTCVNASPMPEPIPVAVSKHGDLFECTCEVPSPYSIKNYSFTAGGREYRYPLVCFEGIKHIVADSELNETAVQSEIKRLSSELNASALGVMFYNREKQELKPLVYVSGVDTLYHEKSCASGSCAVAAAFGDCEKPINISQPGGIITVTDLKGRIRLCNNLKIIKQCSEEI